MPTFPPGKGEEGERRQVPTKEEVHSGKKKQTEDSFKTDKIKTKQKNNFE